MNEPCRVTSSGLPCKICTLRDHKIKHPNEMRPRSLNQNEKSHQLGLIYRDLQCSFCGKYGIVWETGIYYDDKNISLHCILCKSCRENLNMAQMSKILLKTYED